MDQATVALEAQKVFADTSLVELNGLVNKWKGGPAAEHRGRLYYAVTNTMEQAAAHLSDFVAAVLEELGSENATDLTPAVAELLIRRAGRQIRTRRLEVPDDYHNPIEMEQEVTDRTLNPHLWVVHCKWKTRGNSWDKPRRTHASFVCGRSDGQDWAIRVPGTITTVEKALEWIKPNEVRKLEAAGETVPRQGDIYFIKKRIWWHDMDALWNTDHTCTGGSYTDGQVSVAIQHPQHGTLRLEGLKDGYAWRAIRQRRLGNWGPAAGAD